MKTMSMFLTAFIFAGSIANADTIFSQGTPDGACADGVISSVAYKGGSDSVEVGFTYRPGGPNSFKGVVSFSGLDKPSGLAFASMKGRSVQVCPLDKYILIK